MSNTNIAYLLTGSNLGDRFDNLKTAGELIEKHAGEIRGASQYYETKAWGKQNQPDFLNQALKINTHFNPFSLLEQLLDIEKSLGRIRNAKWGSRVIDIDILLFNNLQLNSEQLIIPHKHLHERNFTLIPLMEIAGEIEHPIFKKTIETLYWESKDPLEVYIAETNYERD